ncbi:MAG: hypothetical protein IMW97_07410 [Firmicutes bacterium]|nr:hypothetical protein [Candidatus Fermentithermobacillaceae bacterium]
MSGPPERLVEACEEEGDPVRFLEDAVWRYFGYPNALWAEKCAVCRAMVARTRKPGRECVDCWHVELWEHGPVMQRVSGCYPTFDEACLNLIEELQRRGVFSFAKVSREPVRVVNTGEPPDGHPMIITDRVLILYATSLEERDSVRKAVAEWANAEGVEPFIPVRRGCWGLEDLLRD